MASLRLGRDGSRYCARYPLRQKRAAPDTCASLPVPATPDTGSEHHRSHMVRLQPGRESDAVAVLRNSRNSISCCWAKRFKTTRQKVSCLWRKLTKFVSLKASGTVAPRKMARANRHALAFGNKPSHRASSFADRHSVNRFYCVAVATSFDNSISLGRQVLSNHGSSGPYRRRITKNPGIIRTSTHGCYSGLDRPGSPSFCCLFYCMRLAGAQGMNEF